MAMNFSALNTAYNHYLTTYAPKGSTPYDSHKKSELRGVYNSIVKLNKETPIFLLDTSKETRAFAVNMKENARNLKNTIASLGGMEKEQIFEKKVASSSNENIALAKYIGNEPSDTVPAFDLEVLSLASPQVNTGRFLSASGMNLPPDNYSFDISISDLNYEFQFNINSGDTNKDVQERLARLITNANIGIQASTIDDASGNSALRLESKATGLPLGKTSIFHVSDDNTSKTPGAVSYFGLNDTTRPPANASFLLNGDSRITNSNTFSVEKTYEITLTGIGSFEGDSTTIGLKNDTESLTENINELIGGYNDFLRSANEYIGKYPRTGRLLKEMQTISSFHKENLDSFGLNLQADGSISVDNELLTKTAAVSDFKEQFASLKDFTHSLLRKTEQVSLNPMEYTDRRIVAYKHPDPSKNFINPYMTSAYSGMMFNSYC